MVEFKDKLGIQFRRKKACGGIGGSGERYFRAVYLQASAFQRINRYGNAIHVAKPNGCAREVYGIAAYFRVFNGGSRGSGSLRSCRRSRTKVFNAARCKVVRVVVLIVLRRCAVVKHIGKELL